MVVMIRKQIRKIEGVLLLWLVSFAVQAQQYTVTGGNGTPLMAKEETAEKLEVYLLNGMANATISYTSSSTNHRWYRYQTNALQAEPVTAVQNGNTSTIRDVEAGYGYFVAESDVLSHYVWIIDYSQYTFAMQSLTVEGSCDNFRLSGEPLPEAMYYYLPASGRRVELERQYEISYRTLTWDETSLSFTDTPVSVTMTGNPFNESLQDDNGQVLAPPLCDTEVTLSGDLFARHFGVEQTVTSDTYEAVAIELHADTTLLVESAPNMTLGEGDALCAPAEVTFHAYANEPVAALYEWWIYRSDTEEGANNPLVLFRDSEIDYTFSELGSYTAEVTVYNRSGGCEASASFDIEITESFLEIPNAFSPGTTPGINDEFRVAYRSLLNYNCWIFNRWGVQMYHSTNPAEGWDGKKGGKYVAPGVYFYIIEATGTAGEKFSRKGSINVLRPKKVDDEIIEQP